MNNDLEIARRYISKSQMADDKNIEFSLSFAEYRKLSLAKKCAYTDIQFCGYDKDNKPLSKFTSRTIDRIDNTKGYVRGNCVSVCKGINEFKGILENPKATLSVELINKMVNSIDKINRINNMTINKTG